jgi:hydroxyacylglutathione hydrolase
VTCCFKGASAEPIFPDGDFDQLFNSIRNNLFTLSTETEVYPGHGVPTTIGEELETNSYGGTN